MKTQFYPRWIDEGAGRLALTHRPKRKGMPQLAEAGCHRIVSILSATEGAAELGEDIRAAGLAWTWLQVGSGRRPEGESDCIFRAALPELNACLDFGESILIHCSAGIHRTGTLAYALLRWRGYSQPDAIAIVMRLRSITGERLRPENIDWADSVALDRLIDERDSHNTLVGADRMEHKNDQPNGVRGQ